jgi:sialic acid synthase SpsE
MRKIGFSGTIEVGGKAIGGECPCFIIAELGYNFSTLNEALEAIDAAAECGADAMKFQTFQADTIVSRKSIFPDEAGGTAFFESQWDEFKQYEMSFELHRKLFDRCHEKGLIPFSTPSYYYDVENLEKLGVKLYKTGADDCTNIPFMKFLAGKGKPLIISTGMSGIWEVGRTLEAIAQTGNSDVAVLQAVSNYPVEDVSTLNLKSIRTMAEAFGVITGFSDHTQSLTLPAAATALGMKVYERHFTLDKKIPAPDCAFSADPGELKIIVDSIRETEAALGDGIKKPSPTEVDMRRETRKSLIAARELSAGTVISPENTIIKRPGTGIFPSDAEKVYGMKLVKPVAADMPVKWNDLKE